MVKICEHKLNEHGDSTVVARCSFAQRNDAVSYMNILTQVLRPDAGYEDEQGYWWVRNHDGVTRFTIQA
jgi:hypothetical protein